MPRRCTEWRRSATSPRSSRVGCCCSRWQCSSAAGALVGQALVRAVTAGASDLPTWRAIGADRAHHRRAPWSLPTVVTAAVGAVTAVVVAIALSPAVPHRLDAQLRARHRCARRLASARDRRRRSGGCRPRNRLGQCRDSGPASRGRDAPSVCRRAAGDLGRVAPAVAHRLTTRGRARPGAPSGPGSFGVDRRDRGGARRRGLPHVPGRVSRTRSPIRLVRASSGTTSSRPTASWRPPIGPRS